MQTTHLGRPLLARYDLRAIGESVGPDYLSDRPRSLWRYEELLPLAHSRYCVTLNERMTPLTRQPELGADLGVRDLWVKDETTLPTGSFKDRGMAIALSVARELGIRKVALPTAGNAGTAVAAYARAAGIDAYVFMPSDAPLQNQYFTAAGAHLFLVEGVISDCARFVEEGKEVAGWFDMSTLREPYRLEGKKTMAFELAEQLGWVLPDVILYPTGGGTGLIGMWKAFHELQQIGWLRRQKLPRMVAVQSTGCRPLVRAWEEGRESASFFEHASTVASGLRVPATIGDFLVLRVLRESGGMAIAVEEETILDWMRRSKNITGLSVGPESATCVAAGRKLIKSGWLSASDRVVIFNCGPDRTAGNVSAPDRPVLRSEGPIDWDRILSE